LHFASFLPLEECKSHHREIDELRGCDLWLMSVARASRVMTRKI
jgi:hypothetical protein